MMQAYLVVFTEPAIDDLDGIRAHIGADNPGIASRVAVQIVAVCDRLEHFPERGRPGQIEGTRELFTAWPHVIIYRVKGQTVEILRVWHGAQDR